MKRFILSKIPVLLITIFLSVFMSLMPLFAAKGIKFTPVVQETYGTNITAESISVYDSKVGIINTDMFSYICGVLMAELLPSTHPEVMKAFALAAYSGTLYKQSIQSDNYRRIHMGAPVCTDPSHCKGYISYEDALSKWGETVTKEYYGKVSSCVSEVFGEAIFYDGKVINAPFFAISAGRTENAEDVWGAPIPYLVSVDSSFESEYDGFCTTKSMETEKFISLLLKSAPEILLADDPTTWNFEIKRSEGLYVKEIKIGDTVFSGRDIREMFSLKSHAFDISLGQNEVIFTVYGYGHGVGLSYTGAMHLAENGYSYKDILCWYYSGVDIKLANLADR